MKTYISRFASALLLVLTLAGCELDDPQPSSENKPVWLKKVVTSQGDEREFFYSPSGWLTAVTGKKSLALNSVTTSDSEIVYDSWGRISYVLTDGPGTEDTENVYYYTSDNQLYKLDELVNDQLVRYHTFEYDTNKKLKTLYTYMKDPATSDASVIREGFMYTYTYDANGNLSEQTVYIKSASGQLWQLMQTMKFEDYDTKVSVQHLTQVLFTPGIVQCRNNPGKLTITYANGNKEVTTFTYQYNSQNLPVKRTTQQGNSSYTTEYIYLM